MIQAGYPWRNLAVLGGAAGVGKTIFTTGLLRFLHTSHWNPQPLKALAVWDGYGTHPAEYLRQAACVTSTLRTVNPHSVELVAARCGLLSVGDERRQEVTLRAPDTVDLSSLPSADMAKCIQTVESAIVKIATLGPIVIEGAGAFGLCDPEYDLANVLAPQIADAQVVLIMDARSAQLEQQLEETRNRVARQGLSVAAVVYNRASSRTPPDLFPGPELLLADGDGYLERFREGRLSLDQLWDARATELSRQRHFGALLLRLRNNDYN